MAYSSFQRARIGLLLFVPFQTPENNEQAIRGNADKDAHEAFETGRNIGYRAWPLNQRDQKAEDKLGGDVADAIAAILNVVTDPNSDRRLARARAPIASYSKGEVMEPLLEFLNDEAWWGFRSSSFAEERATRIACGRLGTSCPMAVLVQSVRRESRRTRVP